MCVVNLKVDLLLTIPIGIICTYFSMQFVADQTEVSKQDELFTFQFGRMLVKFGVLIFAIHDQRKTQIRNFIASERVKSQQVFLQNIFDKQPDGIIILSAPVDPEQERTKAKNSSPKKKKRDLKKIGSSCSAGDLQLDELNQPNIIGIDEECYSDDLGSSHSLGSSFASFVNSTHHITSSEDELEVVFYNKAMAKMLKKDDIQALNEILHEPILINSNINHDLSLYMIA